MNIVEALFYNKVKYKESKIEKIIERVARDRFHQEFTFSSPKVIVDLKDNSKFYITRKLYDNLYNRITFLCKMEMPAYVFRLPFSRKRAPKYKFFEPHFYSTVQHIKVYCGACIDKDRGLLFKIKAEGDKLKNIFVETPRYLVVELKSMLRYYPASKEHDIKCNNQEKTLYSFFNHIVDSAIDHTNHKVIHMSGEHSSSMYLNDLF
ncbi:MAG: hypothetical protein AB1571_02580 [Nanoarchaeota archaeon]